MKIAFYGDSLTKGIPGVSFFRILKAKLPEHALINYGKGGDTVVSLYRRIIRERLDTPVDIAFLWVGVNDVFVKVSPFYPVLKTLLRQPWAKDQDEFRDYYRRILDALCPKATKVVTVSPLLLGEDVTNRWNRELVALCEIIPVLSGPFSNVDYLDLRSRFERELAGRTISGYLPASSLRVLLAALLLQRRRRIDEVASARGLHLTLDGVHLNSAGAKIVAEVFLKTIKDQRGQTLFIA